MSVIRNHRLHHITNVKYKALLICFIIFFNQNNFCKGSNTPYQIKRIVIDAGHGGKDSGCVGAHFKTKEKDVTLAIALLLGKLIQSNYPDLEIIYTRKKDEFIELHERAMIANRNKADLFISIHCNAMPAGNNHFRGTETYIMGTSMNSEVVKRENSVVLLEKNYKDHYNFDPNSPEGKIMIFGYQTGFQKASLNFASLIEEELNKATFFPTKGVKQAGLLVLRSTACPSVLIETGFLTNITDENYLIQEEGRNVVAMAIYKSFVRYKMSVEEYSDDKRLYTIKGLSSKTVKFSKIKPITPQVDVNLKNKTTFAIQFEALNSKSQERKLFWDKTIGQNIEILEVDQLFKYVLKDFDTRKEASDFIQKLKSDKKIESAFIIELNE